MCRDVTALAMSPRFRRREELGLLLGASPPLFEKPHGVGLIGGDVSEAVAVVLQALDHIRLRRAFVGFALRVLVSLANPSGNRVSRFPKREIWGASLDCPGGFRVAAQDGLDQFG
jgi:hypothetical protein